MVGHSGTLADACAGNSRTERSTCSAGLDHGDRRTGKEGCVCASWDQGILSSEAHEGATSCEG